MLYVRDAATKANDISRPVVLAISGAIRQTRLRRHQQTPLYETLRVFHRPCAPSYAPKEVSI